jgi:hypothetical protein
MMIRFFNKMVHHLGRQDHILLPVQGLVYPKHPVPGQKHNIIPLKEPVFKKLTDQRHIRHFRKQKALRNRLFNNVYQPHRP